MGGGRGGDAPGICQRQPQQVAAALRRRAGGGQAARRRGSWPSACLSLRASLEHLQTCQSLLDSGNTLRALRMCRKEVARRSLKRIHKSRHFVLSGSTSDRPITVCKALETQRRDWQLAPCWPKRARKRRAASLHLYSDFKTHWIGYICISFKARTVEQRREQGTMADQAIWKGARAVGCGVTCNYQMRRKQEAAPTKGALLRSFPAPGSLSAGYPSAERSEAQRQKRKTWLHQRASVSVLLLLLPCRPPPLCLPVAFWYRLEGSVWAPQLGLQWLLSHPLKPLPPCRAAYGMMRNCWVQGCLSGACSTRMAPAPLAP